MKIKLFNKKIHITFAKLKDTEMGLITNKK